MHLFASDTEYGGRKFVLAALGAVFGWTLPLYRTFSPFWLFQDVNQGSLFTRAAASAHNRKMSEILPSYLRRWLMVLAVAGLSTWANDALAADGVRHLDVFGLLSAASALVCAYAVCAMIVIGYAWCNLRFAKH